MPRVLRWILGLLIATVIIGGPLAYARLQGTRYRNVHVVREGVLYRCAQLPVSSLKRLIHDHGIRTIISLRDTADAPDLAEEAYCLKEGIRFVRLPPRPWSAPDGSVPAEETVKQFCEVMNNPANHPVLVHSFAGIHRTGICCAVYRMEFEGWSNARAIAEMCDLGYSLLEIHTDVREYLEQYRPHITSPRRNADVFRRAGYRSCPNPKPRQHRNPAPQIGFLNLHGPA